MNTKTSVGFFLLLCSSLFIAVFLFFTSLEEYDLYQFLWVLPVSYFIALFVSCMWIRHLSNSITCIVVYLLYYLRMVITPFIMVLGSYQTVIDARLFGGYISPAILLMSYETMIVFLSLAVLYSKVGYAASGLNGYQIDLFYTIDSKLIGLCCILLLYVMLLVCYDSTVFRATFLSLINVNKEYFALSSEASGFGTISMFVEIMKSVFLVLQVIGPPVILYFILRIQIRLLKYGLAFLLVFFIAIFATEDRINSLLASISLLLTARDALGLKFRRKFKLMLVLFFFVALLGIMIKGGVFSGDASFFVAISQTLNAYFGGIPTVATGLRALQVNDSLTILQLIPDWLSKVPYLTYACSLVLGVQVINSSQIFNSYLASFYGKNIGQILPSTIVGLEYFGPLLGPFYIVFFIFLALKFESKIGKQGDLVHRNLFYWITINLAISPVLTSVLLITAKLYWFVIIWLILRTLTKNK